MIGVGEWRGVALIDLGVCDWDKGGGGVVQVEGEIPPGMVVLVE